jgi:hypothetical protein
MPTAARPNSLQQAASAVFAVTTVVPLLIFVWTLHRLGSLSRLQSQIGLGLALGIALLGYYIFRRLMGQMSELIRGLGRAVERGARSSDGRLASAAQDRAPGLIAEYKPPAVGTVAHQAPAAPAVAAASSSPITPPLTVPRPEPVPARMAMAAPAAATVTVVPQVEFESARPQSVPGLGMIQEVDDLSRAMAKLWMSEAAAYQGQRVALSIMNSRAPITGTLIDLTQDGLLIEQDGGGQVAVSYARLSGIDAA